MVNLTVQQKIDLFSKAQKGEKIADLCRQSGISRYTYYKWYKRWQKNQDPAKLEDQRRENIGPLKRISKKREEIILDFVLGHPRWSSHSLAEALSKRRISISNHGIQRILERYNLNTQEKRQDYQKKNNLLIPTDKVERYSPEAKLRIILSFLDNKESPATLCRQYGISRYTFYKWLKRYKTNPQNWQTGLLSQKRRGENHWHYLGSDKQQLILNFVVSHPDYSCHRLAQEIHNVSHHGIQNVLLRCSLNTLSLRKAYAQAQNRTTTVQPAASWADKLQTVFNVFTPSRAAAPPPTSVNLLKSFLFSFLFSFCGYFLLGLWTRIYSQAPAENKVGIIFATLALLSGSIFFIYSIKYYLTLALVLGFSRHTGESGENGTSGVSGTNGNGHKSWLAKVLGGSGNNASGKGYIGGLQTNLDQITLTRQPFVSIHLAVYNERKVVNRLLTACTSMDYPNFEVIVVDDST
ncbi:MAG: helix-turn-helix domain-containing protein, partial [Candidatus Gottesmanbacteria bacterium]